ncbi:MAG: YecH family metal-binding protein [Coraliomargarita sp.]
MNVENIEIHGHEVLEMMIASGIQYSVSSLEDAIHQKFGTDARFYICSGGGMTAAQLIETLWAKGKFAGTPEAFVFDTSKRCNH